MVYDFSTWESFPKGDLDSKYWEAAVKEFNRHTQGTWTSAFLAEAIKQDEGRFGKEGGITRTYNSFRCAFHAGKAKALADVASEYAAAKGQRFWLGFYLPDTDMLGANYRLLDKATPLMCPMIYGPVETGNPDRMRSDTNYLVPPRPRHSKAIICIEAGFPDTGGRKALPIVMRAIWSTMLSHADGYTLWHAAFASEESELAISNQPFQGMPCWPRRRSRLVLSRRVRLLRPIVLGACGDGCVRRIARARVVVEGPRSEGAQKVYAATVVAGRDSKQLVT